MGATNTISAKRICALATSVACLMAVACHKDSTQTNAVLSQSDKIAFNVTSDNATTRTASDVGITASDELLVIGDDTISISLTASRNTDHIFGDTAGDAEHPSEQDTRGIAYTGNVSQFFASAYLEGGNTAYFENLPISVSGNVGNTNRFWPNDRGLDFFAYAISKGSLSPTFTATTGGGSFTYNLPAHSTNNNDAANQPDIIMAITPDQQKQYTNVPLTFHHALAAVAFKIGSMPANTIITSISINNVLSSGSCSFVYSNDQNENVVFTWSNQQGKNDYTQTFSKNAGDEDKNISTDATTFMMIPQTLLATAELSIEMTINDKEYTLTKTIKDLIEEWEADHKYTFTISVPAQIEVSVEDEVKGNEKSDLHITNTGINDGYIRAAIVGYWVDQNGNILVPWNESDGTFSGFNDSDWFKGSDGFYYHQKVVAKGQTTSKLFEKYTLKADAPVVGATLQLSIVAQIVEPDGIESSGWPVTVSNGVLTEE